LYQATSAPGPSSDTSQSLVPILPQSPLDATYRIGDREVTLISGLSSTETAPGSASVDEVRVWGEPVMGDVDGDGRDDAVLLLTQTTGGSGTFYYATVALADDAGYLGMNAVYLGDRIAPQNIEVKDEVVVVNYAEHAPDQALTDAPREGVSARLTLVGIELMRVDVSRKGEQVLAGNLVYGHEARTFTPCGGDAYWIATTSRARAALVAVYEERTQDTEPYTPVYLVVSGVVRDGVQDGFGADYPYSIDIAQVLSAPTGGTCTATSTQRAE
jgi:hypothetical protein